jgi:GTP-binding protein
MGLAAKFVRACVCADDFPRDGRWEIALTGRSNVGKSSLLNRLVSVPGLARVSKTPGRTREIHFYQVGQSHYIVDLPGFGYAKASKSLRQNWVGLIDSYLRRAIEVEGRLALVCQLVDIRHEPQPLDHQMRGFLDELGLPSAVILTKSDKLSRGAAAQAAQLVRAQLRLGDHIPLIATSSETKAGMQELNQLIETRLAEVAALGRSR